jgi:mono/diheme cytochrome c family protein
MPVNEELATQALNRTKEDQAAAVPSGLLKRTRPPAPEKDVEESQMADFSTPLEELMPGPNQMIQNEMMGPPQQAPMVDRAAKSKKASANPFGLTDDQFQAVVAGVASVVAFSKPVQSRLRTMVPKFVGESGEVSLTGLAVSALIAAILYYFAKKYVIDK